jgi:hypothetical protein
MRRIVAAEFIGRSSSRAFEHTSVSPSSHLLTAPEVPEPSQIGGAAV